jgi:hypothetical protein
MKITNYGWSTSSDMRLTHAATNSSITRRYGPALSAVTSTGTGPWRTARVKNRRT